MDYCNHLPHPTVRCFFLWHPHEFNLFNRYRKYRYQIGSLPTSIDIEAKIQCRPNLITDSFCYFAAAITTCTSHWNNTTLYPTYMHFFTRWSIEFTARSAGFLITANESKLLDQGLYQPLLKINDTVNNKKYLIPLKPLVDLRVHRNDEYVLQLIHGRRCSFLISLMFFMFDT